MLNKLIRRCIASLLCVVFVGGVVFPTNVLAANDEWKDNIQTNNSTEISGDVKSSKAEIGYYYAEGKGIDAIDDYAIGNSYALYRKDDQADIIGSANMNAECVSDCIKELYKIQYTSDIVTQYEIGNDEDGSEHRYENDVLPKISDTLTGIGNNENKEYDDLAIQLYKLGASQGAYPADLSTLNQRMATFLYLHTQVRFFLEQTDDDTIPSGCEPRWDSCDSIDLTEYKTMLNKTLEVEHEESYVEGATKIVDGCEKVTSTKKTEYKTNGKVTMESYPYSIPNIGWMAVRVDGTKTHDHYEFTQNTMFNNSVYQANDYAVFMCIREYMDWYEKDMVELVKTEGWEGVTENKTMLTYIKTFDEAFKDIVPIIHKIYTTKNPDAGDKSMEDLVNEAGVTDTKIDDITDDYSKGYDPHTDNSTPITQFYTVNSSAGIVSYNRTKVLNDIEVQTQEDKELQEKMDHQDSETSITGEDDEFELDNTLLSTYATDADKLYKAFEATAGKSNISATIVYNKGDTSKKATLKYNDKSIAQLIMSYAKLDSDKYDKLDHYDKSLYVTDLLAGKSSADAWKADADNAKKVRRKLVNILDVIAINMINGEYDTIIQAGFTVNKDARISQFEALKASLIDNEPVRYDSGNSKNKVKIKDSQSYLESLLSLYNFMNEGSLSDLLQISEDDSHTAISNYVTEEVATGKSSLKDFVEGVVDYGVTSDGVAESYNSVTINKYIIEGMGYSASYVPMRTNVYNADHINYIRGEDGSNKDFFDFYVHYGFMRKALYKDTSSSSVTSYYNSGDVLKGSLKVCTLRDLLECGDNEVALYIDSTFYNAEEAKEKGNEALKSAYDARKGIEQELTDYVPFWINSEVYVNQIGETLNGMGDTLWKSVVRRYIKENTSEDKINLDIDEATPDYQNKLKKKYKFSLEKFEKAEDMELYLDDLRSVNELNKSAKVTDSMLKAGENTSYDIAVRQALSEAKDSLYVNLSEGQSDNDFSIDLKNDTINTDDNMDSIVLTSAQINKYMSGSVEFSQTTEVDDDTKVTNTYTSDVGYSPMLSLAFVSCLYRDPNNYTVASTVESNNPVFLASPNMTTIENAPQWYRNTLLNWALLKNLKGNAQLDISYVTDLDCPVYMDIFGNILTESGVVVIPAASNATLHCASFKGYNYSLGLYTCYGKEYYIPTELEGAQSVLYPYFVPDLNAGKYVLNAVEIKVNDNNSVRFDSIDTYSDETKEGLIAAYKSRIASGETSRLNWMAMVKIINEVMRGAPIESIDKDTEGLYVNQSKSGLIAAAKLESMLGSLKGSSSNTLLCIPDFTRMENMEYWVSLLIKIMMAATVVVIIIAVYRDAVSNALGFRTAFKSLSAIALTVSCIVVVPSIFQLTYYSANKLLLENEALRILMLNEEKRQGGVEVGITKMGTVGSTGDFAVQLDWLDVPWYRELENVLYGSVTETVSNVRHEAEQASPIIDHNDVTIHNDGVYITTDDLMDSVQLDYTFNYQGNNRGLYLNTSDSNQTLSFYSPYYVFLRSLVADVNEYNRWIANTSNDYTSEAEALDNTNKGRATGSYNYTTKYFSGDRLKTVGLCKAYFTSTNFMEEDSDLLRIRQIYSGLLNDDGTLVEEGAYYDSSKYQDLVDDKRYDLVPLGYGQLPEEGSYKMLLINPVYNSIYTKELASGRALLFDNKDIQQFRNSLWYSDRFTEIDYSNFKKQEDKIKKAKGSKKTKLEDEYKSAVESSINDFNNKCDALDKYARDFIARNGDMLDKVSDDTFIKVMALAMSIKYNQLFGVSSANSIEMYNLDSEDIIRLCVTNSEEAVLASSMSYSRFIYTFGGETGVYAAAILSMVLWLGSFIKPLCTVIVFVSVFLSIFVFRVVLQRPSANLWGYLVTTVLLCATNMLHAILLKIGISLPSFGLSATGCIIFMIVGQVVYLLVLSYVTGISLKDWSNLGATEYSREGAKLKSKFKNDEAAARLNGRIKHHENNWDYYDDLVNQHRSRNSTL